MGSPHGTEQRSERAPSEASAWAVEIRGLTKRFRHVLANDGIDLKIRRGSIHGIVGENGAGKSTAMKMLYGLYRPDSGEIRIAGEQRQWRSPQDAIEAGVGMVHQHFMLASPETALDNILLGAEPRPKTGLGAWFPRGFFPMDRAGARERLQALATQNGLEVPWDAPVETLPVGVQQRIEILKLLYRDAQILILDEPTAVLTPQETDLLFENLRRLRDQGKTILVITHKLREVLTYTDRVTVFRAGRVVDERDTKELTAESLAESMVGRRVNLRVQVPPKVELGPPVLRLEELTLAGAARGASERLSRVSFEVRGGEVVGVAGVEGNGQSELLQALFRPADREARTSGRVSLLGEEVTSWSTRQIRSLSIGWIPEDRLHEGLLLQQSLVENLALGRQREKAFRSFGGLALDRATLRRETERLLDEYDVRPRAPEAFAGGLSGGNQQKLIFARELSRNPRLIVAAQPTRGVDVGAIEQIHSRLLAARTAGAGVLLVSSELDEILGLSDRIIVLYRGRIAAEFTRESADVKSLGLAMGGGARP
jgi:ABC-type uncharacterized transport system ATPase subunit